MSQNEILGVGEFQVYILLWWSMIILVFRIVTVIVDGVIACMKFLSRWRFVGFDKNLPIPHCLEVRVGGVWLPIKRTHPLWLKYVNHHVV